MPTRPEDLSHVRVFSCTRGSRRRPQRCRWCGNDAKLLCDAPAEAPGEAESPDVAAPPGATCSAPFCERHGVALSQSKHLCVGCAKKAGRWRE